MSARDGLRMQAPELVVRGRRVITPDGVLAAAVHVHGGRITAVAPPEDVPEGAVLVDAGDLIVLPGLVDTHVHVNEPGRTDWEGFRTATRAAAAGGVTTIVDMPLNCIPPTTTPAALEAKRLAAAHACHVDVGFWGGIVPGNDGELAGLADAGVFGFKAFLTDSGVEEFGCVSPTELRSVMGRLADLDALTIVHAEDPDVLARAAATVADADPRRYATYLASRPDAAETEAVADVVEAARGTHARVHILHLSSAQSLDHLRQARSEGVAVTAETCPHYLALAAEDVPDGATAHKCAPPVRSAANADKLWAALGDGTLSLVVSDHSPCPPALKQPRDGNFLTAWGGIASLQLGLAVVWTAARSRGYGPEHLVRWMCAEPAALIGSARKGAIAVGRDADLVLFDPDTAWRVDGAALEHRHPVTPYAGQKLYGVVRATYLRGREVARNGAAVGEPGGRLLVKGSP